MKKLTATKICAIVALFIFLIDLFFNAAAAFHNPLLRLFYNNTTVGEAAALVPSAITPSKWIFFIWNIIYLYQLAWVVVSIILAFKSNVCIVPVGSYVAFMFACIFNFFWLFLYTLNQIATSYIIIVFLLISITVTAYWGTYVTRKSPQEIIRQKTKTMLHGIFLNGVFLYWAWVLIAVHFNLDNLLVVCGVDTYLSGAIVLGILAIFQVIILATDRLIFTKATIYNFVVFPVFLAAIIAIITSNGFGFFTSNGEITGLAIFNGILALFIFGLKIYFFIRHRKKERSCSPVFLNT